MNQELRIKLRALREDINNARQAKDWLLLGFALNDLDTILSESNYKQVVEIDKSSKYNSNEPKTNF